MQTWAKRGLHTALVTGGLLMLGTGIASADEDVNPDRPASPLDAAIAVPIHLDNNIIGTPVGQRALPAADAEVPVNPGALLKRLPGGGGLLHTATPAANAAHAKATALGGTALRGNRAGGELAAPVDVSGNAVALGGGAEAENTSSQTAAGTTGPITTDGSTRALAGNVVALDWSAPVQVTGNAVGALDDADVVNTANQSATSGGGSTTSGRGRVLAGNTGALHGATPFQFNGNAIAGAGNATTDSTTSATAASGGALTTDGAGAVAAGNAGALPVATPVHASGQALGVFGIAESTSHNTAGAQAGAQALDFAGSPTYLTTYAPDSVVSGNVLQPAAATPTTLDCATAGVVGNSAATCAATATAGAGGGNRTDGTDGVLSGSIATAPAATPVEVIGTAAGVAGNSTAADTHHSTAGAGGHTHTHGRDSTLGGALVSAPVAGPVDLCGSGLAGAGDTSATCDHAVSTQAGGDAGTTGDNSVVGGNGVVVPVAAPVESTGNGGGALGTADFTGSQQKDTAAGGNANTADDGAVAGANLVQVPLATPVQFFGNAVGTAARTGSTAELHDTTRAGGKSTASGVGGVLSGNIAQTPSALPTQGFGANGVVGGIGSADATNTTSVVSGSAAGTDGSNGSGSGNIVSTPTAGAAQGSGDSVAVFGRGTGLGANTTSTTAGGTTATSGQSGNASGNVVSPALLPVVQPAGTPVAVAGADSASSSTSQTTGTSGGNATTDGRGGYVSGNLFDVPAASLAQVHGDAVSAGAAQAGGTSDHTTTGSAGGHSETSGENKKLSGLHGVRPIGVNAPIYNVPVKVLADAVTDAKHTSDVAVGEEKPLELPPAGALPLTKPPTVLNYARSNPLGNPLGALGRPLNGLTNPGGLPLVGGLLGGGNGGNGGGGLLGGGGGAGGLLGGLTRASDGGLIGSRPAGRAAGRADYPTMPMPAMPAAYGNPVHAPYGQPTWPTGVPAQVPTGGVPTTPSRGVLTVPGATTGRQQPVGSVGNIPIDGAIGLPVGKLTQIAGRGVSRVATNTMAPLASRELPQLPTGAVPQLPTGGVPQLPTGGVPQLPTGGVPQLPTGGVPQLPTGGLPQLPTGGVPQLPNGGEVPLPTGGVAQLQSGGLVPQLLNGDLSRSAGRAVPPLPIGGLPPLPNGGALPTGGVAQLQHGGLLPQLPTGDLTRSAGRDVPQLPTGGLPQLPTGGVPQLPNGGAVPLPTGGVAQLQSGGLVPENVGVPQLPVGGPGRDLPQLPIAGVTQLATNALAQLPSNGLLPLGALSQLSGRDLPQPPATGGAEPVAGVTQLATNTLGHLPTDDLLPGGLPTNGLLDTVVGVLPAGLGDNLPGRFHTMDRTDVFTMPGLDAASGMFAGDLFEVPEVHTLPATGASGLTSLTDTQSKLADLFGTFPKIG
ncbi:hypothetical protein L6E12_30640 [Actinokineospora sp. PR83]|uniref:beta strand repeat-containing protein n=1 Tax=Actinokineospora sp. PR83 TaxID=2884908 RepID=UPI001F456BAC|nr:hypothetical protein [Actinokineospora sp. PR83]MCG8920138.1 hypothetical protein [Actinokineospora sp. PR83]